ncbi:DUF262 domain-containing protein [Termitidicoccus mucosus]
MTNPTLNSTSAADLIAAIDSRIKKVHTQRLDMSFNELVDMYGNKELDISPDYQRLFQWTEGARSRFIESLLLEMPVPPIYVVEEDDGRYLLIDGLQRISSYLHLRGLLNAPHLDPKVEVGDKLVLADCDIVNELNGKTWDDLGTSLQIKLKRAFVGVEVVRKGSDARFKYHMFKRLNTGGQVLSSQQVRNCTIRLLDGTFNDFIIELSKDTNFSLSIETITSERRLSAFDQELILRFFSLKNNRAAFKHDVSDFMTEYMEQVADSESGLTFDYNAERLIFTKTFSIFAQTLGPLSFTYASATRGSITKGFSVYHFEAFSIGIQEVLDKIDISNVDLMAALKQKFTEIKLDSEFLRITTGGGKNSPGPLAERINFVAERLRGLI